MSTPPVARTSTFTKTSIRILNTILLVGLFPGVSADCYIDLNDGNEYCGSILDTGAIVGIAVGGVVCLLVVGLVVWACLRRRSVAQTNIVYPPTSQAPYIPPAQPAPVMAYGSPYGGGQPPYTPYDPLPVQKGASPYVYDRTGWPLSPGYVQGAASPPQHDPHSAAPAAP